MLKNSESDCYGIIGQPISHSLSPYIHHHFAKLANETIVYHAIESNLDSFNQDIRGFLYYGKGMNVTAPFKQLAFKTSHEISEMARSAQAVNTLIKRDDNSIMADNTDGAGFIRDLTLNENFDLRNKTILIIGAGGAARGVLASLIKENPQKVIATNRSFANALKMAEYFDIEALALEKLGLLSVDLIIQASSVMPELPVQFQAQNALCYDLNYGQRAADFKRWAKQQQAHYLDGIGTLVEQAAEAFYLWRGVKPSTNELIADLRKSDSISLVLEEG